MTSQRGTQDEIKTAAYITGLCQTYVIAMNRSTDDHLDKLHKSVKKKKLTDVAEQKTLKQNLPKELFVSSE